MTMSVAHWGCITPVCPTFLRCLAELYEPENMPEGLLRAHDANDELLERIYIGRRFRNDTERLEKLFELYTKMTQANGKSKATAQ